MKQKIKWLIINSIVPVLVGAFFYYIFCPDVVFVKKIDDIIHLNAHCYLDNEIVAFSRNYLLDALWAYAFMNAIYFIMGDNIKGLIFCCCCTSILAVILEVLQLSQVLSGTFDIVDIIVELNSIGLATFLIKRRQL